MVNVLSATPLKTIVRRAKAKSVCKHEYAKTEYEYYERVILFCFHDEFVSCVLFLSVKTNRSLVFQETRYARYSKQHA